MDTTAFVSALVAVSAVAISAIGVTAGLLCSQISDLRVDMVGHFTAVEHRLDTVGARLHEVREDVAVLKATR